MKHCKETIYQNLDSVKNASACQTSCPINTKVPMYVSLLSRRRFEEAWEIIKMDNPFPTACGRVCHHPCQTECQADKWGGPVSIRLMKRLATDYAFEKGINKPRRQETKPDGERIAVIGAGPSGLAAANDLADKGYRITVFERLEEAGGAMAACIPQYRLPREMLNLDIENILHKGVDLRLNTEVGQDITFQEIREKYKAVYVATGCHKSKMMHIEDEDADGVLYSMAFLNDTNLKRNKIKLGRRAGIIGGGNAAVDAARVSKRHPGCEEVTLIYRRTRAEMPAYEEEIEAALEEGIKMLFLTNPAGIVTENGKMVGVKCLKMELGEPDDSGRRRPIPVEGSEFVVHLDNLIIAIGEDSDIAYLGDGHGLEISRWHTIEADANYTTTNVEGVFAGGDVVTGPKTVIEAIAAGKKAAIAIDKYLRGSPIEWETRLPSTTMYMNPDVKLAWR